MQSDPLTGAATIVFGLGLIALAVVYFLSVKNYISPVSFSFAGQFFIAIINIIALALYVSIIQINANSILILTSGFTGLVLGFLIFGARRLFIYKNRVEIKRSVISGVLLAISYVASAFFNIFGGTNLMAFGVVLLFLSTGVMIGSLASDCINGADMESQIKKGRKKTATEGPNPPIPDPDKTDAQKRLPIQ